jgi:hypothetical protein
MAALYRQRQAQAKPGAGQQDQEVRSEPTNSATGRDVFICHASEDKNTVARPLAQALIARRRTVWLDELELTVGDSLSGHIDAALAHSRFGVVVLSPAFFAKPWPQRELAGLAAREMDAGSKVILPVWHDVDHHYIAQRSPTLADRVSARTNTGIGQVADEISLALEHAGVPASADTAPESSPPAQLPLPQLQREPIGIATEIVTRESVERELSDYIPVAGQILLAGDVTQTKVDNWASGLGIGIRTRGPKGEEEMFLAEGNELTPRAELDAKVARLQNHILPKVRAGEWTR